LAAIAAIAIHDLERGAEPSRGLALGCAVLGFVLYRDMALTPEKALSVFSIEKVTFPKSFEGQPDPPMKLPLASFARLAALAWVEAQPSEVRGPRLRTRAVEFIDGLQRFSKAYGGNLLFSLTVLEAALVGLGAMLFFGRWVGWSAVDKLPKNFA